jgi:alpha-beta hydrolase superfamily lysophospholipase
VRRWGFAVGLALVAAVGVGCATLDERERAWIFQPSDDSWGASAESARGMQSVWIDFHSRVTGGDARLHGLWLAPDRLAQTAPVILYLHGARWNVETAAPRMRRLSQLGFAVLAIDYRGFGKSSPGLPSEDTAYEDARAAWAWLAARHPQQPRYIYGHSLGGAVAIDLASRVDDARGTIVEGTFSSIADVASGMRWGWLPVGPLITQHFDSVHKVAHLKAPLLVIHGDSDRLIQADLGRRLYDAAQGPKRFLLVEGGSHHSAMAVGFDETREAMAALFGLAQ